MDEKFTCFAKCKGCDAKKNNTKSQEHPKHFLDTTQIEFFNKFKEENCEIDTSISDFVQQKPWYVKPITICDTCCCHYHVEVQLYYDTFLNFGKRFLKY